MNANFVEYRNIVVLHGVVHRMNLDSCRRGVYHHVLGMTGFDCCGSNVDFHNGWRVGCRNIEDCCSFVGWVMVYIACYCFVGLVKGCRIKIRHSFSLG